MKFNIKIVYGLLLALAFVSCSSSDDENKTPPSPYTQYGAPFDKMPKRKTL